MKKVTSFKFQVSSFQGFTLIELLLVLAIIGVLASFLMANFIGAKAHARDGERKSDLQQIRTALELYKSDQGAYPPSPLPACGGSLVNGGVTYIQKIPCDPLTSADYTYTQTGGGTGYTLRACLENVKDSQKDAANGAPCTGGTTNWSLTLTNP